MKATSESIEWIFLATNLGLEILSAACDQASSPRRPHFALFGMLLAIAAVLISIGELIYRGKNEGVVFRSRGMLLWFYHPPIPPYTPFGTLPDIYGLVAGISQCICSIVQYVYCLRHADSPLKASLLPAIFLMCLVGSRLSNKRTNANLEQQEQEQLRQQRLGEPQEQVQEQVQQRRLGEPQEQVQEQLRQRRLGEPQEQEQEQLQQGRLGEPQEQLRQRRLGEPQEEPKKEEAKKEEEPKPDPVSELVKAYNAYYPDPPKYYTTKKY